MRVRRRLSVIGSEGPTGQKHQGDVTGPVRITVDITSEGVVG